MGRKGPLLGHLRDLHGQGRALPVTGPLGHPQQMRPRADIGRLKRGRVFQRMGRHDAVVGIGGGDEERGIIHPVADPVQGRIGQKGAELILDGGAAIFLDPHRAAGEAVKAQHVHHPHVGQDGGKQVRSLIGDRRDQKPAIRLAVDGQPVRRGDAFGDQVFARRNEVVEHGLLSRAPPGMVPGRAIFPAPADVRHRIDAALFHPGHRPGHVIGDHADAEPAIAGHHGRSGPGHVRAAHDEDRDAGAVGRGVEALLDHHIVKRHRQVRILPRRHAVPGHVQAQDGGRNLVAGKEEVAIVPAGLALEQGNGSGAGQVHRPVGRAVQPISLQHHPGIDHIGQHDPVAHDGRAVAQHRVGTLGDQLGKGGFGIGQVDGHHPALRRAHLRRKDQPRALCAQQRPLIVMAFDQGQRLCAVLRQIRHGHGDAARQARAVDHQKPPVARDGRRMQQQRVGCAAMDQPVLGLGRAKPVEIDRVTADRFVERGAVLRGGKARIVEPRSVAGPGDRREARPFQTIVQNLAGDGVHHVDAAPVRAVLLQRIGHEIPAG